MTMKKRLTSTGKLSLAVLVLLFFLFSLMFSSCAHNVAFITKQDAPVEMIIQNLASLAADKPLEFFQTFTAMTMEPEKEQLLEANPIVQSLSRQAVIKLVEAYKQSKAASDYKNAMKYFYSLKAIAGMKNRQLHTAASLASELITTPALFELLLAQAQSFRNTKQYAPAKSIMITAFNLFRDTENEFSQTEKENAIKILQEWSEYANANGDKPTASLLSNADIPGDLKDPASSFSKIVSSVVTVYVDRGIKFQQGAGRPDRVLGSAFQIDPAGYYLTNYHVIASEVDPAYNGYSKLSIRPSDNPDERIPAKVIGWNKEMDLALLKSVVAAPFTLHLSEKAETEKGQQVFAIGSPIGLENTITSGIISATGRRLLTRGDVIQIDVPVNPGNSGGPLVDRSGKGLGIVFAGMKDYQGINFALPLSWINIYIPSLFLGGAFENPILGVLLARNFDGTLDVVYTLPQNQIFKAGDRLVMVNEEKLQDISSAQYKVAKIPLGSLVRVDIIRDEKNWQILKIAESSRTVPLQDAAKKDHAENLMAGWLGVKLEHVSGPRGPGGLYKVLRTWPGLAADEAGIREGDTIKFIKMSIDQRELLAGFVVSVVSRSTGYLERSFQLIVSLESTSLL